MKNKLEKLSGVALAIASYGALLGMAVWRRVKGKPGLTEEKTRSKVEESPVAKSSPEPEQKLESLSLDTPGDAALDRIARIARSETWIEQEDHQSSAAFEARSQSPMTRPATEDRIAAVLEHQSLDDDRLEGWNTPRPDRLPIPTFAPAVMALGVIIFALGLATTWYVCLIGSIVFAVAAWRWVGELQGEQLSGD